MSAIVASLPDRLVGFSTKTYFSLARTQEYSDRLLKELPESVQPEHLAVFMIPSFPALPALSTSIQTLAKSKGIAKQACSLWLGAQNCNAAAPGAFTGEVTAALCAEAGCILVELGHAERRVSPFNETDEFVAAKTKAVVQAGMIPLVCIGERSRPSTTGPSSASVGAAVDECAAQIRPILASVPAEAALIFAYEPVWAIGASQPASGDYVRAVVSGMRAIDAVRTRPGPVRWLYGGSAGPGVWAEMGSVRGREGVDGLFLGRFAHDVNRMLEVVQEVQSTMQV